MPKFVWKNAAVIVGGVDLSCDTSATSVSLNTDALDVTALCGDGTREYIPGLKSAEFSHEGFWDPLVTADVVYNRIRAASDVIPMTFAVAGTAGSRAYTGQTIHTSYAEQAEVGTPYNYTASGVMSGKVSRGFLLQPAATEVTASGNGTAVQLGAAASGEKVYSSLHVIEITGGTSPDIAVTADSDDASGFASGVTRLTHATLDAVGSDFQELAGPVTDTWWRSSYTITGSPTAVRFVHVIGIASA